MINVFQPELRREELEAVEKVFASNWVGKGKVTREFETRFAAWLGVRPDVLRSVQCCTEGLFQAMELLGIGPDDEVVLPTISFVGAGNAIAARGARPVFCDVQARSLNPTARTIEPMLTPKTKAVLLLHYGGVPCEMDAIVDLTASSKIALVEDSACSVASRYRGRACGTMGDIGVWSFDAMKILVAGDGGMVWCRHPDLAKQAELGLNLGLGGVSGFSREGGDRWWEFEISGFGRRAIMNDISSAIAIQQLAKLPQFIARRRQIDEAYRKLLADVSWLELPPEIPDHVESSYYFFWIQSAPPRRDGLATFLRDRGIYTTFRYHPLHRVQAYGTTAGLPGADLAADRTLCIPLHHSLSDSDVDRVVSTIRAFHNRV